MGYDNVKVKPRQKVAPSSQTKDLGIVTNVPMGEWNATTPYMKLNMVRSHNATYQAKKNNQGVEPTVTNGWQEVWQVVAYDGGAVSPDGTYPNMSVGNDGTGQNIAEQFASIRQDIENESHFRGVFTTVAELKTSYPTATPNDYAYITGGNIWVYQNNEWIDSGQPVPNSLVPASTSIPLMDGTGSAGTSDNYARGDHRHPSDTSKANTNGTYPDMTAGKADALSTARTIDGVSFDGRASVTHYGVCPTAAATGAKAVGCPSFVLVEGARITVNFANSNTVSQPTLNVNGTGAVAVRCKGRSTGLVWKAEIITFVYDGTYWQIIDGYSLWDKSVNSHWVQRNGEQTPAAQFGGTWQEDTDYAGRVSVYHGITGNPLYKGTYNSATQYYQDEIVLYSGNYYVATQSTTGNLPTNTTYWTIYQNGTKGGSSNHAHRAGTLGAHVTISSGGDVYFEETVVSTVAPLTYHSGTSGNAGTVNQPDGSCAKVYGGTQEQSSMQPYIVDTMWKRTA